MLAAGGPRRGARPLSPLVLPARRRRRAVVYFDYTGCGRSDRLPEGSEYSIELFADDIDAVRRHLGLERRRPRSDCPFGGLPGGRVRTLSRPAAVQPARPQQRPDLRRELAADEHRRRQRRAAAPLPARVGADPPASRAAASRSLDPEYQELVARVLPDLEWVDPWNHSPLSQPAGGFEEAVYRSVIGADPEWVVDGTLRGYDPLPRIARDPGARRSSSAGATTG